MTVLVQLASTLIQLISLGGILVQCRYVWRLTSVSVLSVTVNMWAEETRGMLVLISVCDYAAIDWLESGKGMFLFFFAAVLLNKSIIVCNRYQ